MLTNKIKRFSKSVRRLSQRMLNLKKRSSKHKKFRQFLLIALNAKVTSIILYTGADGARILKKILDAELALKKN